MAEAMTWQAAVDAVRPYIVRIVTPQGSGTGFIICHAEAGDVYGVATAAHVVAHAFEWELPIRIEHFASGQVQHLRHDKRAIFIDNNLDSASIVFNPGDLKLPIKPPPLIEENRLVKVGVEVGWLGFPAVSPRNLCFFHGRISAHLDDQSGYLVDGVAINGVSGGPTLWLGYDHFDYVGLVSAYIPNRATGESLPGLAVVRDVSQFYDIIKNVVSVDEARKSQPVAKPADPLAQEISPAPDAAAP
jgi:hypothetical protein